MRRMFTHLIKDQKGSVAILSIFLLTALLGVSALVMDFGVFYLRASRLQDTLDSAVLAGVQELPAENAASAEWIAAKNEAIAFAAFNDIIITTDNIQPVYQNHVSGEPIVGMAITKSESVEYYFAKIFGMASGTVTRSATAGLTPAGGVTGAVPLSITTTSLNQAIAAGAVDNLTIKCSNNTDDIGIDCTTVSGWFGALQFDGTGANVYSDLLAYGYNGNLHVGQILDMEEGNMSGPSLEGFSTRYYACTDGCTADSFQPDCPRLVYIPVVKILSQKQVQIEAFAAFFLTECGGNGNNSYIKATYIKHAALPNQSPGVSGMDFGLYVAKLLN